MVAPLRHTDIWFAYCTFERFMLVRINRGSWDLPLYLGWMCYALPALRPLAAQTDTTGVTISGTVIEAGGAPVEGAEVRFVGTDAKVMTSVDGAFRLIGPRRPNILVQIRRPGYSAQLLKLDGDWRGTILLERGVFQLPEIQVSARYAKPARYAATTKYDDYFRRRRLGLGQFIDHDAIERRLPLRTENILEGQAGIRVNSRPPGSADGTVISFSRCNEFPPAINVYVDGRKLIPEGASLALLNNQSAVMFARPTPAEQELRKRIRAMVGEMLDRVNPRDIEMVEIFRGPGELPAEFNDGNCGAVVIWTRTGPG
jgi:hypothetical protein